MLSYLLNCVWCLCRPLIGGVNCNFPTSCMLPGVASKLHDTIASLLVSYPRTNVWVFSLFSLSSFLRLQYSYDDRLIALHEVRVLFLSFVQPCGQLHHRASMLLHSVVSKFIRLAIAYLVLLFHFPKLHLLVRGMPFDLGQPLCIGSSCKVRLPYRLP